MDITFHEQTCDSKRGGPGQVSPAALASCTLQHIQHIQQDVQLY